MASLGKVSKCLPNELVMDNEQWTMNTLHWPSLSAYLHDHIQPEGWMTLDHDSMLRYLLVNIVLTGTIMLLYKCSVYRNMVVPGRIELSINNTNSLQKQTNRRLSSCIIQLFDSRWNESALFHVAAIISIVTKPDAVSDNMSVLSMRNWMWNGARYDVLPVGENCSWPVYDDSVSCSWHVTVVIGCSWVSPRSKCARVCSRTFGQWTRWRHVCSTICSIVGGVNENVAQTFGWKWQIKFRKKYEHNQWNHWSLTVKTFVCNIVDGSWCFHIDSLLNFNVRVRSY